MACYFVEHPIFYAISQLSYSIYLLNPVGVFLTYRYILPEPRWEEDHYPKQPFGHPAISAAYMGAAVASSTAVTLLLALLMYCLVEKPGMNLREVIDRSRSSASGSSAGGGGGGGSGSAGKVQEEHAAAPIEQKVPMLPIIGEMAAA